MKGKEVNEISATFYLLSVSFSDKLGRLLF